MRQIRTDPITVTQKEYADKYLPAMARMQTPDLTPDFAYWLIQNFARIRIIEKPPE